MREYSQYQRRYLLKDQNECQQEQQKGCDSSDRQLIAINHQQNAYEARHSQPDLNNKSNQAQY